MKVSDYAFDVNLSVAEILKKCHELEINVKTADDYLSDDDIIMLDNTINIISTDEEITYEEEDDIDDKVDEIISSSTIEKKIKNSVSKEKLKKKDSSKQEFNMLKKEMYKHKNKLMSNKADESIVVYKNDMSVSDFANALNVSGTEIIKKLMENGLMLSLNQPIDFENAEIIALDYHKTLKKEETQDVANFESFEVVDNPEDLVKRPPIVTIMGHVDHGKTTLLDYIRNTHVVDKEFGGITQHIGAYQTKYKDELITFIDTPGHAAFTEMRARGASVTDIVIIIVAADDGVKPQTKEAVDHALSAKVPIIVAVNKIDKPEANIDRVLTEMAEIGITPESWGGDVPFINISAHTGEGVDLLLETILTIAEVNELKANPNRYAIGAVIESRLDKNIGAVCSILIQNGTLRLGDPVVVGNFYGKIRTLKNDRGENILNATPSTPVEITGLNDLPVSGDKFMAFETEKEARKVSDERILRHKEANTNRNGMTLDDLFSKVQDGAKKINIVLKTDVKGSEEAIKASLQKLNIEGVSVDVIRSGVGTITESDIVLASASNALIYGFNVRPNNKTMDVAKQYGVEIRLHNIIYKMLEELEQAIKGMLDPEYEEKITGEIEVRQIFRFSKVGVIAGSHVTDGVIKANSKARLIRDGIVIYDGKIASLQREKDKVNEVKKGMDCGVTLENFMDIKENDIIETYEMVEIKR